MLPSQFLNVVLGENEKHGTNSSVSKIAVNFPKNLPMAVSISPAVPKSVAFSEKKMNGQHHSATSRKSSAKFMNGSSNSVQTDLKKLLPRTVLEECVVELSDTPVKAYPKIAEPIQNHVIIEPMYAKPSKKLKTTETNNIDFGDIFNNVEAVYSDDEEQPVEMEAKTGNLWKMSNKSIICVNDQPNSISFACDQCPNKYANKGALWQHNVATHSVEKNCQCQLCGRKFYRNCSLALHMKCHTDEQNCSCKICGKEFNRVSTMERHVKCHATGEDSESVTAVRVVPTAKTSTPALSTSLYTCKICQEKFEDKTIYKSHVFSHTEKFACEHCNVAFNTKQLLDMHFHITHKQSETPFACKLCKARFANLRELNEHVATHTYEKLRFSCHHCGETFTQRSSYKKHVQLHVGERLRCTICRIDFTQRSSLLRHYKRLHLMSDIPNSVLANVAGNPNLTIITK